MKKQDISIRNITIASIKRHLMSDADPTYSKIFETLEANKLPWHVKAIESELPIAGIELPNNRFTLVTTRRVITSDGIIAHETLLNDIASFNPSSFKSDKLEQFTIGNITLKDNRSIPVFIETGKSSMIIIYAIKTSRSLVEEVSL